MVTLPPPNVTTVTIAASRASTTNRLKDPTLDPVIREATHTNSKGLQKNKDGSVDVYFGPKAPADKEANWVQTAPDKFWFPYFRDGAAFTKASVLLRLLHNCVVRPLFARLKFI